MDFRIRRLTPLQRSNSDPPCGHGRAARLIFAAASTVAAAACARGGEIGAKAGEADYDVCLESHLSADAGDRQTGKECEESRGAGPLASD